MSYVEMRQTLSEIVLCLWKQGENNMKRAVRKTENGKVRRAIPWKLCLVN